MSKPRDVITVRIMFRDQRVGESDESQIDFNVKALKEDAGQWAEVKDWAIGQIDHMLREMLD